MKLYDLLLISGIFVGVVLLIMSYVNEDIWTTKIYRISRKIGIILTLGSLILIVISKIFSLIIK